MRKKLLHLGLMALPFVGFGQVVLSENFNAATLPSTWTVQQTNTNETWGITNLATGNAASVDYDADMGQQNEWLISPSFSLANATYYYLNFKVGLSQFWAITPNNNYDVFAKISTDNGVTWTQLWTETNMTSIAGSFGLNNVSVDISNFKNTPNLKIAFQYVGSDGAALYLDDVSVEGATSQQVNYCGPLSFVDSFFGDPSDEPITLVNFAGINNTTDDEAYVGNSHEFFLDQIATVTQGQSYDITLKGNTGGNYENSFAVFIDWNQNGTLDDAGEVYVVSQTITNSTGLDAIQAVHSIAVPSTALTGNTRMRVKKIFGSNDDTDLPNPCLGSDYGQAEDYTVNVVAVPLAVNEANAKKSTFKVYPNPATDILNIDSQEKVKSINVFDRSGRNVLSSEINQNKFNINVSNLSTGTYILNAQTEKGSQSVKVIKK